MEKQVVLVVMDGVGKSKTGLGDAVGKANTPTLDKLLAECPHTYIKAHGTAVGLPSDEDMGNSEVGHNALGCGQVYSQGAKLVEEAIESGDIFASAAWRALADNCLKNASTMHFIGLLSDGNVHSNIAHLIALIKGAKADGIKRVRVHALLDGRDVPATSALVYVEQLEKACAELNDASFDARIASGGGRMKITMDRYFANWDMVKAGFYTHVYGEGRGFATATEAIETFRKENAGVIDQDLPAFVITEDGKPVGAMSDGDSVVLFNFRGDRAIELSMAFDNADFTAFDRGISRVSFLLIRFWIENKKRIAYMRPFGEGDFRRAVGWLEADSLRHGHPLCLLGVTPRTKRLLQELFADDFAFIPERDYFDYIYLREELVTLRGKKLQPKRNHVNRFKKQYAYEYLPLTPALVADCLAFEKHRPAKYIRHNLSQTHKIRVVLLPTTPIIEKSYAL